MARRAQASAGVCLIVGLAPSLLWLAVFVAMSLEFEFDRWQFPSGFPIEFSYFGLSALGWIVLPAVPLLLGTLPFLRTTKFGKHKRGRRQAMPNWKKMIRERLRPWRLSPEDREDVITELSAHLEETYGEARSRGLTNEAAIRLTCQEVNNWRVLARKICRAKGKEGAVNPRTKTLWIPGLASLLSASLLMTVVQWMGIRPRLLWLGPAAMTLYWSWLAALPICGALSSYLSQSAGGDARTRLAAASFPVLWLLFLSIPMLPVELAHQDFSLLALGYFFLGMTNWVVIPGCALLLGALPFLRHSPLSAIPSASHH